MLERWAGSPGSSAWVLTLSLSIPRAGQWRRQRREHKKEAMDRRCL